MKDIKNNDVELSEATLRRLPQYYCYLEEVAREGALYISSSTIAQSLHLSAIQVRKDLASVSSKAGKPRKGFVVELLLKDVEEVLGYNNHSDAVLVGAGRLGKTLLSYEGFENYGLHLIAAFDSDPELWDTQVNGKTIFPLDQLTRIIQRLHVQMAVLTVPKQEAQNVCDILVEAGIKGIWNFAPIALKVPADIVLKNENLAASLAYVSQHLKN